MARRERDPTTEVVVDPMPFVRKRENMCSFEAIPYLESSPNSHRLRYNATLVSLAYFVLEYLYPCSRAKGFGPGDNGLVGDIDGVIGDDEVPTGEERLRVLWECLAVLVLEEIGAGDDKNDIDHRVEVGVGDARVQN